MTAKPALWYRAGMVVGPVSGWGTNRLSRIFIVSVLLLCGCSSRRTGKDESGPSPATPAVSATADLALTSDLGGSSSVPADAAAPWDFAGRDQSIAADLSSPADMSSRRDLAGAHCGISTHICSSTSECCYGWSCNPGLTVCAACGFDGVACTYDVDCCTGLTCIQGYCNSNGVCNAKGAACSSVTAPCCSKRYCDDSTDTCVDCRPSGSACTRDFQCCSGACLSTTSKCY